MFDITLPIANLIFNNAEQGGNRWCTDGRHGNTGSAGSIADGAGGTRPRRSCNGSLTESVSIAHEVNQPLAAIATNATAGLRWLTREVPELDKARACVSHIVEEANRASETIRSVRDLARRADPGVILLDINEVIDEAVALSRRHSDIA
jgi:signal transduction histidine kinase